MIPVHQLMPNAIAEVLRKAPMSPEKVAFAWRASVGPAINKVTTIELRGRVLYVRTKDPSWQREVERSLGIVRSRMEALLGHGAVGDIRVTAD
jgi:Dna[CI] antecedent DciA-like protein